MNFQELNEWAINMNSNKDADLTAMGVKTNVLNKVRNILKDGISVRCKLIIANTEKNNKHIGEIEDFIKQLTKYGISPSKEEPKADAKT